jgi:hypothetical protein
MFNYSVIKNRTTGEDAIRINDEPFEEYLGELLQDIIHRQVEEINNIA